MTVTMDRDSPSSADDAPEQLGSMLERLHHATNELYASTTIPDCTEITGVDRPEESFQEPAT